MSGYKRRRRGLSALALGAVLLLGTLAAAAVPPLLVAPPAADDFVDDVFAFPVPWKPNAGSAADGTLAGGITFASLPVEGTLRIYTLSGRLIRSFPISLGTIQINWDGRAEDGTAVRSGVYLWVVKSGRNSKSGKLVVIR